MKLPLSPRLQCVAGFVPRGSRVADIGCDHGYLSIHLLQSGIATFVYASDIGKGPLQSALNNARRYGMQENISFHLSDGVSSLPRDFDTLVCAGMGGDTMVHILQSAPWLQHEQYTLVLQCQSKTPMLRKYLSETGWRIHEEAVVRDGKFLYTVMQVVWQPDYPRLTLGETYFPPALLENPSAELPAYYRWVVQGLRIAVAHQDGQADSEKSAALKELEALAQIPQLTWLKEEHI